MARGAKYLPRAVSEAVKATGAHFMCILSKAVTRGYTRADLEDPAKVRPLADECVREGKVVPIRKLLEALK